MLTAVVLTHNEEANIVDCLEHLDFSDEILVIDDKSTDRTVEIVRNLKNSKVKIISRKLIDDFSEQRNFVLDKAKGDWVLFIDADERVDEPLKREILETITNSECNGFYINRLDNIWGRVLQYGECGNTRLLRLAKKDTGRWVGRVHEVWNIKGKKGVLSNELLHYPHPNISEFIAEIDKYTTLRSEELYAKHKRVVLWDLVFYPAGKFVVNYFIKQGFRDGIPGFVHATIMSFHSFLVRGKLFLRASASSKKSWTN